MTTERDIAWRCSRCGQVNSGWAKECGWCEKPETPSAVDIGLIERLRDEAALCRSETAVDVAELLDEATETIERLTDALTAAEKDGARFNWLEKTNPIIFHKTNPTDWWTVYMTAHDEDGFTGSTLRDAIDAAMEKGK